MNKKFYVHHDGLAFASTVYARNKRDAVRWYRQHWGLVGKHLHVTAWLAD